MGPDVAPQGVPIEPAPGGEEELAVVDSGCERVNVSGVIEPRLLDELVVFLSLGRLRASHYMHHPRAPQ